MTSEPETPRRICVVDDHSEFRESTAWLLEGLGYEVSAFEGPAPFLQSLEQGAAEGACLLLDVRMPDMSGLELLDAIHQRGARPPVIFMTGHGDVPLAVEAMRKGAITFLEKPFHEEALEEALQLAFQKQEDTPSAEPRSPGQQAYADRLRRLTERERQVMDLVVGGDVNKVIAYKLGISAKTVELHRSRIMVKMEARSLTMLVRMAVTGEVEND